MKCARNIKLRTYCGSPSDLALMSNHNPLKRMVIIEPSYKTTTQVLGGFKKPLDMGKEGHVPSVWTWISVIRKHNMLFSIFFDKDPPGWICWDGSIELYQAPDGTKSTFQPWETCSQDAITAFREWAMDPSSWEQLAGYYSEENLETVITQDNVSCVKSICMTTSYRKLFSLILTHPIL